jgi:transcriptional regulator with XRE-family HTH domain
MGDSVELPVYCRVAFAVFINGFDEGGTTPPLTACNAGDMADGDAVNPGDLRRLTAQKPGGLAASFRGGDSHGGEVKWSEGAPKNRKFCLRCQGGTLESEVEPSYPRGAAGFGQRLGAARREMGTRQSSDVSKAEVGRWLDVSGVQVGNWESGDNTPNIFVIEQLAKRLGVSPGWLAFGQEPKKLRLPEVHESETTGLDIDRGQQQRDVPRPANPEDEQSGGSGRQGG